MESFYWIKIFEFSAEEIEICFLEQRNSYERLTCKRFVNCNCCRNSLLIRFSGQAPFGFMLVFNIINTYFYYPCYIKGRIDTWRCFYGLSKVADGRSLRFNKVLTFLYLLLFVAVNFLLSSLNPDFLFLSPLSILNNELPKWKNCRTVWFFTGNEAVANVPFKHLGRLLVRTIQLFHKEARITGQNYFFW